MLTKKDIVNLFEYCPNCRKYKVKAQYSCSDSLNSAGDNITLIYDYMCTNCGAKFAKK